jgi:hypothetical protein
MYRARTRGDERIDEWTRRIRASRGPSFPPDSWSRPSPISLRMMDGTPTPRIPSGSPRDERWTNSSLARTLSSAEAGITTCTTSEHPDPWFLTHLHVDREGCAPMTQANCTKCLDSGFLFEDVPVPPGSVADSITRVHQCDCSAGQAREQERIALLARIQEVERVMGLPYDEVARRMGWC